MRITYLGLSFLIGIVNVVQVMVSQLWCNCFFLQIMTTIPFMDLKHTMLTTMRCTHTTKATMKSWEFRIPKTKDMARGNCVFALCILSCNCFLMALLLYEFSALHNCTHVWTVMREHYYCVYLHMLCWLMYWRMLLIYTKQLPVS